MIQVWLIDDQGFYQNESKILDEIGENMTTVPLTIGYVKPYFNKKTQEWSEGATQNEIDEWYQKVNSSVPYAPSLEEKISILENQNKLLNEAISELSIIMASNL